MNRHPRHLAARAALAVAALLAVTACTTAGAPEPEAPPDPDLSAFEDQELDWGDCAGMVAEELLAHPTLECAYLEVPLDYEEPDAGTAEIAMLRIPATGQRIGSLLLNPGGPGVAGTSFAAALAPVFDGREIGERFDVVGFDPRGVGASEPAIDCFTDVEQDAGSALSGFAVYDVPDSAAATDLADRCLEASGGAAALTSIGSVDVVQDMDLMRHVLGDEQLSFIGSSYGTELGAMYAQTYPEHTRAIVLDGAVDPILTADEFRVSQIAGFQEAFDAFAAWCTEQAACPLRTDTADAVESLHSIVEPLDDSPAPTQAGRPLTTSTAMTGVLAGMYAQDDWPLVLTGLTEAADGHGDTLLGLHDRYYDRTPDGAYGNDPDVTIAIRCMDWPSRTTQEQAQLTDELLAVAPMLDVEGSREPTVHECSEWPEPANRDEPWLDAGVDVPDLLVVSVTGDPATPHSGGIAMAETLGARLLTVEGARHVAYILGGSPCVDETVDRYLIDLELPEEGATCTLP